MEALPILVIYLALGPKFYPTLSVKRKIRRHSAQVKRKKIMREI